jgi:hypothetical protein
LDKSKVNPKLVLLITKSKWIRGFSCHAQERTVDTVIGGIISDYEGMWRPLAAVCIAASGSASCKSSKCAS